MTDQPIIGKYTVKVVDVDHSAHVLGILSIIFAFCSLGTIGLILGLVGLLTARKSENRTLCIVGIALSSLVLLMSLLVVAGLASK